jgi:hypothetical protein
MQHRLPQIMKQLCWQPCMTIGIAQGASCAVHRQHLQASSASSMTCCEHSMFASSLIGFLPQPGRLGHQVVLAGRES